MSEEIQPLEIAESELLTGLAKLLVLIYLGNRRKVDIIKAGLGSSTLYYNLLKGVQQGLLIVREDKIELTEKGRAVAKILYDAFKEITKVEKSSSQ